MTTRYKTQGIVFKKDDRNESDRIFTIFTKDFGKLEVRAKAVRKIASKLKSGIDIFYLSEIEFIQGKSYKTLTDALSMGNFNSLFSDHNKLKIAAKVAELLDNFLKGQQKDENIWILILDIFEKLNSEYLKESGQRILYYYFLWNFFSELGFKPEVEKCVACRGKLNPYNIYFSSKEGGVICKQCLGKDAYAKKIKSDFIKLLRLVFKKDWQIISKLKLEDNFWNPLKDVSDNYYAYILSDHSFGVVAKEYK